MMTEIDSLKLLAGGRFIFIRFFLLVLGVLSISSVAYFKVKDFSLILENNPFVFLVIFGAIFVNLFLLLGYNFASRRASLRSLQGLNLIQIIFDVCLVLVILALVGSPEGLWGLLFLIPILETVLVFDNNEAVWVALLSSGLLFIFTIIQPYQVSFSDQLSTLTLFPTSGIGLTINFYIFVFVYLFSATSLPYYNGLLRPKGLASLKKVYLNKSGSAESNPEQIQWIKNYSKRLDENNRLLRAKELELSLANQKLDTLEHAKSEFISVATHQLRTPLSAIKWTFNMILSGQLGELNAEQKEFLDKGYESSLRMIGIVNNLVHIDHNTAKKEAYNFEDVDLIELIKNISFEFSNQAESKNIKIQVNPPQGVLPKIALDPNKVRMVIENLLDNAIKYTPREGRITLTIKDDHLNSADQSVEIVIADTGVGIPKDEQKKIFRKFFRASNARLQEPDGSGIGLYIAKDIIERHDGTLWFESEEGKGTTFFITLPVHQNNQNSV